MKTHYFLKSAFTLFILGLFSFQTKADPVVIGGIAYNLVDSTLTAETAKLPDDAKYTGSLVIPASVSSGDKTYAVVKIGDGSLRDAPDLTSVTLPKGLKTIGNSSFASCTGLTSLTLPETVNSIEDWSFYECTNLASINIPDGVTKIGEHVFQLSGLTSITLPASVTSLKTCAFQNASKLASINMENVTEIANWALFGTAITSVTIGNVFKIGSEAFKECFELETIHFSGSVVTIEDWAFQNTAVKSLTLPSTLVNLGGGAFADCAALESVTIPKTVKSLKDWTFSSGPMKAMYVSWDNLSGIVISENAFGNSIGTPTWHVPSSLASLYGTTWNSYPVVVGIPAGTESVQNDQMKVSYINGVLYCVGMEGYNASILTMVGSKVTGFHINSANEQVSVTLPAGIYLLRVANGNNKTAVKFIVR